MFARAFFLPEDRSNLPKAPGCGACNHKKSILEHYAATVLPIGARHPQALINLATMVPGRLNKNQALRRKLMAGEGRIWVREGDGVIAPTKVYPVDGVRLKALFEYIVKGLVWHHSRAYLSQSDVIEVNFPSIQLDEILKREFFAPRAAHLIAASLGNGTIAYEGLQASDEPRHSYWRISIYGGLKFSTGNPADGISNTIAIFTSRKIGESRSPQEPANEIRPV